MMIDKSNFYEWSLINERNSIKKDNWFIRYSGGIIVVFEDGCQ